MALLPAQFWLDDELAGLGERRVKGVHRADDRPVRHDLAQHRQHHQRFLQAGAMDLAGLSGEPSRVDPLQLPLARLLTAVRLSPVHAGLARTGRAPLLPPLLRGRVFNAAISNCPLRAAALPLPLPALSKRLPGACG